MNSLPLLARLFEYSDWANAQVLSAAAGLSDEQLDRPLEIGPGPGTLRRVLMHTWAGEDTWLRRWRGEMEAKWPAESERLSIAQLRERFETTCAQRAEFVGTLSDAALDREQMYRDSRGGVFSASLGDMLLQGIVHSVHHRAQATNAIRRLGGAAPEMDYMMRIRRPG
ncbi:MAG: DinB family protein [Phycisphaeraceae bacterium]|nr:DinB family protein [Phycisphaeraceae bacterium]